MTWTGRVVVALGSIAVGVIAVLGFSLIVRALFGASFWVRVAVLVAGIPIFGFSTAAAYTWTMDGPFVLRCNRARVKQASRSDS